MRGQWQIMMEREEGAALIWVWMYLHSERVKWRGLEYLNVKNDYVYVDFLASAKGFLLSSSICY